MITAGGSKRCKKSPSQIKISAQASIAMIEATWCGGSGVVAGRCVHWSKTAGVVAGWCVHWPMTAAELSLRYLLEIHLIIMQATHKTLFTFIAEKSDHDEL